MRYIWASTYASRPKIQQNNKTDRIKKLLLGKFGGRKDVNFTVDKRSRKKYFMKNMNFLMLL
jgi:hypothetical protein